MERRGARTTNQDLHPEFHATERREKDSGRIAPRNQLERTPIPPQNSECDAVRKTVFGSGAKVRLLPARELTPVRHHCDVSHSFLKVAHSPLERSAPPQPRHSLLSSPVRFRLAPERSSPVSRQCRLQRMGIHN